MWACGFNLEDIHSLALHATIGVEIQAHVADEYRQSEAKNGATKFI